MEKNVASQKWAVFAFDRADNTPKTGDAANITAKLSKNGAAGAATNDVNPTELESGYYVFDLLQAETNYNHLAIIPVSATADIQVIGCPVSIYTSPPYFNALGIESDGDLTKVDLCAVTTENTDMVGTDGALLAANVNVAAGIIESNVKQIGDDAQSATDLKDFADAGYDPATNKVQGVVLVDTTTDVTNEVSADVTKISGDSNSANNLELDYDGTGYAKANSTIGTCTANTDMRGTDGANTTVPDAAGTAAALHATTDGKVDGVQTTADAIEVDTQDIQGRLPAALVTGRIDANVGSILDDVQSATDLKDFADAGYDPATNKVQGVVLVDTTTTNTDMVGTDGANTVVPDVAGTAATLHGITDGKVDDVQTTADAIETDTQDIQGRLPAALVTGRIDANVGAISDDATAADNLEATYDGTGYDDPVAPSQQQQVDNLSIGTAGISTIATSENITLGNVISGDYTNTAQRDGVYHQVADDAGTPGEVDFYYELNVGGNGVPVSVSIFGRSNSGNDDIKVYGYNWGTTTYEQIGTIAGQVSSVDTEHTFTLYTTHVGTAANLGKVRIRFANTGLTSSDLYIDQFYVTYSVVVQSVGYANGAVWVDTNNGVAGTTAFVNGVADNPVDSWADALTIAAAVGLSRYIVINGSSIQLSANSDHLTLLGQEWTLDLNGQSCDDAVFQGAHVTGTCTGSEVIFRDCDLAAGGGTLTCAGMEAHNCAIAGDIVLTATNAYFFNKCYSGIAGTSTPSIDLGAAVANQQVNFRAYSGGIEVKNMGATGTDNMSLEGHGQIVLNANCDPSNSPVVAIRGHFTVTDNVAGGFVAGGGTISDDARYDVTQITDSATSALNTYDPPTRAEATSDKDEIIVEIDANETKIDAVQTTVDAIETDTQDLQTQIGTAGAGLTDLGGMSTAMKAEVESEANDALVAYDPPTRAEATADKDEIIVEVDANETKIDAVQTTVDNIETDTQDIQTNIGTIEDLGTGATLGKNNRDIAGATFVTGSDSNESIRDRGDTAWITGGGSSIADIINIQPLIPNDIDLANTATYRMGMMLINSLDDLPSAAEITPGTISIDRKAIGATSWSSIVSDAACSEIDGLVYYDEVFDSGTNYAEGDSIRITFKSIKVTVAANDYEVVGATGRIFYTSIRQTMRGTDSANTVVPDVAGTAATLHGITDGKIDAVQTTADAIETDTQDIQTNIGTVEDLGTGATIAKNNRDIAGATFDSTTDSNEAIKDTSGGDATQAKQDIIISTLGTPVANVSTDIANVQTDTTAIKAKTDNIPAAPATEAKQDTIISDVADVQSTADAIEVDTQDIQTKIGTPTDTDIATDIANVQTSTDATESALLTTHAEVTTPPGKDASVADKVGFLFLPVKNGSKTDESASTLQYKKDDGTFAGSADVTETATTSEIGKMS